MNNEISLRQGQCKTIQVGYRIQVAIAVLDDGDTHTHTCVPFPASFSWAATKKGQFCCLLHHTSHALDLTDGAVVL